jgi:GNAT superfamily N-acetyltransferase
MTSPGDRAGEIPGWPEAFRSGNRVTFEQEPTEADARWWGKRIYASTGWLPLEFAEHLCARMPGEASFTFAFISEATESLLLRADGEDAIGPIWMHATVLEVGGSRFLLDQVKIHPRWRRRGVSRTLVRNLVETSKRLGVRIIRVDAEGDGGYHWAGAGFLPLRGAWRDIRDHAIRQLTRIGLPLSRQDEVLKLLVAGDDAPELLWTVASMTDEVVDRYADPMTGGPTKLGRALLNGCRWSGELNLEDPVQTARLEEWLAHGR